MLTRCSCKGVFTPREGFASGIASVFFLERCHHQNVFLLIALIYLAPFLSDNVTNTPMPRIYTFFFVSYLR